MLDQFLNVAYAHEKKHDDQVKLAKALTALPLEDLQKLASGNACLDIGSSDDWLEKFRGTPLFDQAMQLERSELENDIAREKAESARPNMDTFWQTASQIRLQKKMLELELQGQKNGGAPGQDLPMSVMPAGADAAQGAGAIGPVPDVGPDGGTMKGASARFEKAAISGGLIDRAVANTVAKGALSPERAAKAAGLGKKVMDKGVQMAGGFGKGATSSGAGMSLVRQGAHMKELASKMAMAKAALDLKALGTAALGAAKANPGAAASLAGAGLGAAAGAASAEKGHRLGGALGGAAAGAALGGAAGGVGGRMMAGQNLRSAVGNTARAGLNGAMRTANRAANHLSPELSAKVTGAVQNANQLGHDAVSRLLPAAAG